MPTEDPTYVRGVPSRGVFFSFKTCRSDGRRVACPLGVKAYHHHHHHHPKNLHAWHSLSATMTSTDSVSVNGEVVKKRDCVHRGRGAK